MEDEPLWLAFEDVSEIHDDQLALYGGAAGIRDENVIHSAVAAPINLYFYQSIDDLAELGIHLCAALTRNHGFIDGNKRTAAMALMEFMASNGYDLIIPDDEQDTPLLGQWIEKLASDHLTETQLYERITPFIQERPEEQSDPAPDR